MEPTHLNEHHPLTSLRVLIVDDSVVVLEALKFVFSRRGIDHVVDVATREAALWAVRRQSFDVVLLDIVLADSDGLDLLEEIKAISPSLPVLMHSYHDGPHFFAHSFSRGASGYLVKGIDINILLDAVRRAARGEQVWSDEQMRWIGRTQPGLTETFYSQRDV